MAPEPIIDEEDYASDEDSDFAPGAAAADNGSRSGLGSESEAESEASLDQSTSAGPKRKRANADAVEGDLENSGDETIIRKGQKPQKKAKRTDGDAEEDEGGEGGLIKTRRQRALEKAERKAHTVTGPVTINVDDLWAQMTAAPLIPPRNDAESENNPRLGQEGAGDSEVTATTGSKSSDNVDASDMIKIKRTYNFAGKVHTEEKLVARDSAEAKLYLASQDSKLAEAEAENENDQLKRKPRKAFRSSFEPAIEGLSQRVDLNLGMSLRLELRDQQAKAKKLNVVEKSRMDWAGFVDKEGIKDELELAGKSKESYVSRQAFLRRVEAKKEEEARRARIAGRG